MQPSEMFLKNTNILQEWLGVKLLLSAQKVKKRLRFATQHVLLPPEYWDDVIFSDVMKIMLGLYIQQRSWFNQDF